MSVREGMKAMRRIPFFQLIPLLPAAMVTGCIAMNISTYRRLHRLEKRLDEAQSLDPRGTSTSGKRTTAAAARL